VVLGADQERDLPIEHAAEDLGRRSRAGRFVASSSFCFRAVLARLDEL
jgi:hypothetical protein